MAKAATVKKAAVMGFISRETYVDFRTACVDGAALPSDYGAFMKDYNQQIQNLRAEGISPTQMNIKPADLVAWCKANGHAVDSKGRIQHANFLFAGLNFKK
jgi:hypothetical protein